MAVRPSHGYVTWAMKAHAVYISRHQWVGVLALRRRCRKHDLQVVAQLFTVHVFEVIGASRVICEDAQFVVGIVIIVKADDTEVIVALRGPQGIRFARAGGAHFGGICLLLGVRAKSARRP